MAASGGGRRILRSRCWICGGSFLLHLLLRLFFLRSHLLLPRVLQRLLLLLRPGLPLPPESPQGRRAETPSQADQRAVGVHPRRVVFLVAEELELFQALFLRDAAAVHAVAAVAHNLEVVRGRGAVRERPLALKETEVDGPRARGLVRVAGGLEPVHGGHGRGQEGGPEAAQDEGSEDEGFLLRAGLLGGHFVLWELHFLQ